MPRPTTVLPIAMAAALGIMALPSRADVFTVGSGIEGRFCDFQDLQEAIDAAAATPGADTIRVTRTSEPEMPGVQVDDDEALTIEGSYDDCSDDRTDHGFTSVAFVGGAGILHVGSGRLSLRRLDLSGHAGIIVASTGDELGIYDSIVHGATNFDGIYASGVDVTVARTSSHHNLAGISISGGSLTMSDASISDNATTGAALSQTTATITRSAITGNGVAEPGDGGGIHLTGFGGSLDLSSTDITGNRSAHDGAGIHAAGGDAAHPVSLVVGAGVVISGNIANGSGGGIHARNARLDLSDAAGSRITLNGSGTFGGGVAIFGGSGDIASSSDPALVISDNYAELAGGGLHAGEGAQVRLFTRAGAAPLRLSGNDTGSSSSYGGAIAVMQDASGARTRVFALDVRVESNQSSHGGGVALVSADAGAAVALCLSTARIREQTCDGLAVPEQASGCTGCTALIGNWLGPAPSATGEPAVLAPFGAAAALSGPVGTMRIDHTAITDNEGESILALSNLSGVAPTAVFEVADSLIAGNEADEAIVREAGDAGTFALRRSTLAGNAIDGIAAIDVTGSGATILHEAVVFQPGVSVFCCSWDRLDAQFVLGHEVDSLPPAAHVLAGDPHFVAADDYHLAAGSPALDVSNLADPGDPDADLDGSPRGEDLPGVPDAWGPRDLGAFEYHAIVDRIFADAFDLP